MATEAGWPGERVLQLREEAERVLREAAKKPAKLDGRRYAAPSGRFDLFQTQIPAEFSLLVGRSESWVPPERRKRQKQGKSGDGQSGEELGGPVSEAWSWTGVLDRIELCKILQEVDNVYGWPLSDAEISYAVAMMEGIESQMQLARWDSALRCCVDLIRRLANCALLFWKAGLCMVAQAVPKIQVLVTKGRDESVGGGGGGGHGSGKAPEGDLASAKDALLSNSPAMSEAALFFKCALAIEPQNRHISGLVDMVLRFASAVPIPKSHRYRDPAEYPRSLGDAFALYSIEASTQVDNEQFKYVSRRFRRFGSLSSMGGGRSVASTPQP